MEPSVGEQIIFWFLAVAVVAGALFTMTRRNPVAAVMSLVGTFFALAAMYATLSAHFLAIIQILVYAGAIMVLFIFVVMIINREEIVPVVTRGLLVRAGGVAAAVYLTFVFGGVARLGIGGALPAPASDSFGTVEAIGDLIFRDFLYPFEAVSLLLLIAVVGGVVISRSHKKEVAADLAAERRKTVEGMAHADSPAELPSGDAHAAPGGHH
jgi:NADH-quinone oxidoreductase subunit J